MHSATGSRVSPAAWLPIVLIGIAIALAAARLVAWSLQEQVSFDGAMNLEVARSLAEGDGYNRMYAGRTGFAHEIQSRAPFILPSAAAFAAFGVGVWQSQLTNLLYVAALAIVVFLLVRAWTSWRWGLFAVAVCLWTPGIREIAMNGYGEVPALVWWLGALLVLCRDEKPPSPTRLFIAGILAGTAVLTKTVLAIGLIAMLPMLVAMFVSHGTRWRAMAAGLVAFVVGLALPGLAYELAHVAAIGELTRWYAWLNDEVRAIHMQAGTSTGFHDTQGLGTKLLVHSRLLADNIGLVLPLLVVWLVAPVALFGFGRRWLPSTNARAALLALAVFAAIYCLWWLGFTPTEKAWYRRVFNGVLVLEIMLVVMAAALWTHRARLPGMQRRAATIACVLLLALQALPVWSDIVEDDAADFSSRDQLDGDLALLKRIPANADVYGVGWYSAPIHALYSGRRLGNIASKTPVELASASPVFLIEDIQTLKVDAARYWLDRYGSREIASSNTLRVIELDANAPREAFTATTIDERNLLGYVDFHKVDYPYLFGFQNREGDGWRWATADVEVLLRYGGERELAIDLYLPALRGYRFKQGVGITAWANGCKLGVVRQDVQGRERWWLPASPCGLSPGQRVTVRLVSDNVYESRDDRQLGFIVNALGFADPAAPVNDAASD